MRLRVRYPSRAALATDVREQLSKGGLLLRIEVPRGLEMYAAVELELGCDDTTTTLIVPAQVLQMFPGLGVAVAIDAPGRQQLLALASGGASASDASPGPAAAESDMPGGTASGTRPGTSLPGAANMEKIQQALRGDRDDRAAVLRSPNRTLHVHVLRNPGLTLDEISAMARMTTVSVEVLKQIAERREWGHRPEIAIALVRNPTVPVPVAVALLDHVSLGELRQLAKDSRTRDPVQKAARKKVLI